MYDRTAGVKPCTGDNLYESDNHDDILHKEKEDKGPCHIATTIV